MEKVYTDFGALRVKSFSFIFGQSNWLDERPSRVFKCRGGKFVSRLFPSLAKCSTVKLCNHKSAL